MARAGLPSRLIRCLTVLLAAVLLLCGAPARAGNLSYGGGPTMLGPIKIYLIYWLPSGFVFDNTQSNGIGNYETVLQNFFKSLSATTYLNITTQYCSTCPNGYCELNNGSGAVASVTTWTDTKAYPKAGTTANPLQQSDIQNEVTRAIQQNHWTADANSEFFVFTGMVKSTGADVVQCMNATSCTDAFPGYCAYHNAFTSNGQTVIFTSAPDAIANVAGCGEGLVKPPNGQVSSDTEVALVSHEFFESLTDPQLNAWIVNDGSASDNGEEIGDKCNQNPGPLQADGSNVTLNGKKFMVQTQWSNDTATCVTSLINYGSVVISHIAGAQGLDSSTLVQAIFNLKNGPVQSFVYKPAGYSVPPYSQWFQFFTLSPPVTLHDAQSIDLLKIAGATAVLNGTLNWTVQDANVYLTSAFADPACLVNKSGSPWLSFNGIAVQQTVNTPQCPQLSPAPGSKPFDKIGFSVTAGSTMASGGALKAIVTLQGTNTQTFTLKPANQAGWSGGSSHSQTFTLNPTQPLDGISGVVLRYYPAAGESWTLQGATVNVTSPNGTLCLTKASGSPLAVLTPPAPGVILVPSAGCL